KQRHQSIIVKLCVIDEKVLNVNPTKLGIMVYGGKRDGPLSRREIESLPVVRAASKIISPRLGHSDHCTFVPFSSLPNMRRISHLHKVFEWQCFKYHVDDFRREDL